MTVIPAIGDPSDEPIVREGSCLLWDYRLLHAGTENLGPLPRPLLTLLYCRPWWIDHKSFRQQAPIRMPRFTLSKLTGATPTAPGKSAKGLT